MLFQPWTETLFLMKIQGVEFCNVHEGQLEYADCNKILCAFGRDASSG